MELTPATLYVLIGPVGAGKTTWAERTITRSTAVFLDLDAWMVVLFGDDPRPRTDVMAWYLERRERCRRQLWDVATRALGCGVRVILESGLITRAERSAFYARARTADIEPVVIYVDAPRDVRKERVIARNARATPTTQVVPPDMFELASDLFEPPDAAERAEVRIVDA